MEGHIASQCDQPAKARLRSVTEATASEYVGRILGIDEHGDYGEVAQGFPPDELCGPHVELLVDAVDAYYDAEYVAKAAERFRMARNQEVKLQDRKA